MLSEIHKNFKVPRLLFIVFNIFALPSIAEAADRGVLVRKIAVINELGRGVKAEIKVLDLKDNEVHFAYTDGSGVVLPNLRCRKQDRLLAKPGISAYRMLGNHPYCNDEVVIRMHLPRVAVALDERADKAFADGKYGVAAMLYTEASARYLQVDSSEAEKVELKAYEALVRRLKLPGEPIVFDPLQDKHVLSPSGVRAVAAFQRANNILPTGVLDSKTVQVMARQAIFPYIKEAYGLSSEDTQVQK